LISTQSEKKIRKGIASKVRISRITEIGEGCDFGEDVFIGNFTTIGNNVSLGDRVRIWHNCNIMSNVKIGPDCMIAFDCQIESGVMIGESTKIQPHSLIARDSIIGRRCFIANGVEFTNDMYPISGKWKPVIVDDDVVIAVGAIIFPGVHIGKRAVICAGAVVKEDVEPDHEVAMLGNMGKTRVIGTREGFELRKREWQMS
jgi:UDP-3-O-[3-hydroxymyristoyl] glucosamine N-acyltransferase